MNFTLNKTKKVAWFVSNCNAVSRRDKLAKEIQKSISVDIYGKCGLLKCAKTKTDECGKMIDSTYKFYLAFENSLCADYVTEKFFDKMNKYVIPIVYNGAEMSKFVPPKSYIDIESFPSVYELNNYLKYLDENPKEYIKYFWWKKYYEVVINPPIDLCKLCEKVNESKSRRKSYNIYKWVYESSCRTSLIRF
jgi:alpha-1,3-fucosyltransferase